MKKFAFFIVTFFASIYSHQVSSHQSCEDVIIGMVPASPGLASYPIYEQRCVWLAGAVAVNPSTRDISSAWNYSNSEEAGNYVRSQCGKSCISIWFYEDRAYIAISADDRAYGMSTNSSNDAIAKCVSMGGLGCEAVVGAGSGGAAVYWLYGSIAYDVSTGKTGGGWNYRRRFEAENAGKTSCGSEKCWVYTFQTGYGAIAKSTEGQLFGDWSANSERLAIKAAEKRCKKTTNDKNCKSVISGAAENNTAVRTIQLKLPPPPVNIQ